jgi:hypothetical protein
MDTASVISIVPIAIKEVKPLIPAEFYLPAASLEEPAILLLSNGINDVYVGEGRGQAGPHRSVIRVPVMADAIAEAVVNDWVDVQYGIVRPSSIPGLFWAPGHVQAKNLKAELEQANEFQMNWFKNLVKLADDDWQKYRQHKTISDIQRYAGNFLKLERPWMLDREIVLQLSECPSCFEKVNPKAIVCAHCRFVLDEERYRAAQFAKAL